MLAATVAEVRDADPLMNSGSICDAVRKAMFKHRLLKVVEAIEHAAFWRNDENEHGLMIPLMDAKNLANAA